jgi:hypothetical protein
VVISWKLFINIAEEFEMPNFKLTFEMFFEDEDTPFNTRHYIRVIVADNLITALKIAEAMVGEEVYAREYLIRPVTVTETEEAPEISAWNENETWSRVLRNMDLTESDVEFLFDTRSRLVASIPVKTSSSWEHEDVKSETTQKVGIHILQESSG